MKCMRCQHENSFAQKFCGECGARLAAACAACGASNPPEQKFCGECGCDLNVAPVFRFASPQQYTPKYLADRILTSKNALEGERKHVTVVFADLKGSMELLAERDPEEARKILDPVLSRMMEAVHRYEGTVNQVMGDGIMALFGAPLALEDHAVRACYAALAMQAAIKAYSEELEAQQGLSARIRVGLNSGEVVVRAIASDLRMDYSAIGETTHLAARMEQLAAPGTILLSAATWRLAEGFVFVKPRGPAEVKGLSTPVDLYELIGASAARSRLQASVVRGFAQFVGREEEVARLNHTLTQARAGQGQVVALIGEPGIGKSRLVWEFVYAHRGLNVRVLQSGSAAYGKVSPYRPLIDLLKSYFEIGEQDDAEQVREKATVRLTTLDASLTTALIPLLVLLDVPVEDFEWSRLDPTQRRSRIIEASRRLLFREAQVQPLLVIFEDLHWIDSETQAFLDGVVESLPTARVLLLVNYRPEYQSRWTSKSYYTQLRIDPLHGDGAAALLETLLGEDPSLLVLKRLLIERTQGNPLFIEESVRELLETGLLQGERGRHQLSAQLNSVQVPVTVQAILASRIDRLAPEDKRLLQAAAVIGMDIPDQLLQTIADLPDERLRERLSELQAREFIFQARLFPDLAYIFKHALTQEVAYKGLLHEQRRMLHVRIVAAIEFLYAERLAEYIEQLAHHAFCGEMWAQAARCLQEAAVKAMGHSALQDAVAWLEQALIALRHLPQSRQTLEQSIDIRFELRTALVQLGHTEQMYQHLLEAERLARTLDDKSRLGRASAYLTTTYVQAGEYGKALDVGQRALTVGEELGNRALTAEMDLRLGQVYWAMGDYARAVPPLRRLAQLPAQVAHDRYAPFSYPVFAAAWLGLCLAETGDFADGIAAVERAIPAARASEQPFNIASVDLALSQLYRRQSRLSEAIAVLESAFVLGQAKSLHAFVPFLGSSLGLLRCRTGASNEGLALLEQSARASLIVMPWKNSILANLAEGYLLANRVSEAMDAAKRALDHARAHNERASEAWTLYLLGDISSHPAADNLAAAEKHYQNALRLATELGMRPLEAQCCLALGKIAP